MKLFSIKLVPGWRKVMRRSISMWAAYLGLAMLVIPEGLFLFGVETSPYLWWMASFVTVVGGNILGRIIDQGGIDRDTTRSPAIVIVIALIVVAALVLGARDHLIVSAPPGDVEEPPEIALDESKDEKAMAVAVPLIAKWEGLRTQAYRDMVGVWTVCYGETNGVRPGDSYTEAECRAMLARQVARYRDGLHRYFTTETKARRLTPERDAAYTSLAYNVGIAGAGRSTATRRLNAGDIAGGCEALTWWNRAGNRVVRGLVRRRAEEHALCMRGLG